MKAIACISVFFLSLMLALISNSKTKKGDVIKSYKIDALEELSNKEAGIIDEKTSYDGKGSLKIQAQKPATVNLIQFKDINAENSTLIYRARIKTKDIKGKAYLEMLCSFKGLGEFFSRGLDNALTGTNDWKTLETPFFLKKGENPDNIKLNVVIEGSGTVWIDDIEVIKAPLG